MSAIDGSGGRRPAGISGAHEAVGPGTDPSVSGGTPAVSAPSPPPAAGGGREAVMARLTAAPGAPYGTPGSRAGTNIPVGNPYAAADVHAALYGAVPAAVGFALDKLTEKYPDVDRTFAARFLELALVTGAEVPFMTYSHEAGHYREAANAGANPSIEMTGWMSGLTHYNPSPGKPLDPDTITRLDTAGVNQESLNAVAIYQKWARDGGVRYQEAMGYLLAQTNVALYAANSVRRDLQGNSVSSDDLKNYVEAMNARGSDVKLGHLAAMAAAADLASAPVWAALLGQIRFLTKGERTVAMPTFQVGDLKSTFPNLHLLLSSNGPVIGGNIVLGPDRKIPVELTFDVRVDRDKAAAIGAKLHDIPLAPGVSLNPFIRATYDEKRGAGVLVGTDLRAEVYKGIAVTGSVAFEHNDLLAGPSGRENGVTMRVGVSIPF